MDSGYSLRPVGDRWRSRWDNERGENVPICMRALRRGLLRIEGLAGYPSEPEWTVAAQEIKARERNRCTTCGTLDSILDVHHSELPYPLDLTSGQPSQYSAAVRAAFKLPWSNGQTEGHDKRLNSSSGQMYGRARAERLRVLSPN